MQIVGFAMSLIGAALWIYGYFVTGTPALIHWPSWVAEFVPNLEAEVGMALSFLSMIPMYWKPSK